MVGTLRRIVRRSLRPLAMLLVAGGVSLSLIVTTPSNAHALVTYPKIPPAATFIMGATKTVAPAAMAAASFTPVGLGLRLAFLAFSTADLWVPLVTQAFGAAQSSDQPLGPNPPGALPQAGVRVSPGQTTSTGFSGVVIKNNNSAAKNVYWNEKVQCKVTATGAIIDRVSSQQGTSLSGGFQTSAAMSCNTGETMEGGAVYGDCMLYACPAGTTGMRLGPENVWTTGTLTVGNPGFDARGADVGYQGRSECISPQGTISWAEGPITPGDNNGGTMLMPSCEKAGKGHGTGRTQVKGFKPDGTTETVWDTGANPLSDPATPLCDPGRTSSGCLMEVTKDGQPCVVGDVECENWASESKKEPNTRYGCKLGPYTLPASACSLLEGAYVPGGSPLNDPNTDGNPDTRSPLGPDPSAPPVSAPAPVIAPAPGSVPGAGGQTAPGADENSKQCFPTGWAVANPVEWVLKPVGCALTAAFVPKPATVNAQQTRIQTKLATIGFAPITAAWESTYKSAGGGSGCSGPTVEFSMNGVQQSLQPFQACTQPMATVAGIANACSAIIIVLFGGLGVLRAVAMAFGFNFTLGKGGDSE